MLGDVNTSLIKTARGRSIMVQHCTNLPRPYSRIHLVQGSKGLFQGYPNRAYIEGRGKNDAVGRSGVAPRRVRAPAVEGNRGPGAGRRTWRNGLHRGLSADQVPARRHADRHDRLRCRGAQRGGGSRARDRWRGAASRSRSRTSRAAAGGTRRRSASCTCSPFRTMITRVELAERLAAAGFAAADADTPGRDDRRRGADVRAVDRKAAAVGLVRARPHRSLRQAHRLCRRPIARRGSAARIRDRCRTARGRLWSRPSTRAGRSRWMSGRTATPGRSGAGPTTWRSSPGAWRRIFRARTSALTWCFRAICREPPDSAVRRRSSSPSPARWRGAPISISRPEWRAALPTRFDLAGYLGAVENGLTLRRPRRHERRRHARRQRRSHGDPRVPRRPRQRLRLLARAAGRRGGDARRLAVCRDGERHRGRQGGERAHPVQSRLAGDARAAAVRARRAPPRHPRTSLAEVVAHSRGCRRRCSTSWARSRTSSGPPVAPGEDVPAFAAADLVRRLRHFLAEDARVPLAADAFQRRDRAALGALSDASQHDADALLGNQIPETCALAALARESGAFAASSFGAGFGGSVWALVDGQRGVRRGRSLARELSRRVPGARRRRLLRRAPGPFGDRARSQRIVMVPLSAVTSGRS